MTYTQEDYLKIIDGGLAEYVYAARNGQDIVTDAMRYSIQNGGKRIRPMLTLEFCRVCGGDPLTALPFACAVEMIHTYSLIHDDLPCMDDDDLRRGKPSCHKKFGESYALLVRELSDFAGVNGMIGGKVIDLLAEEKQADYETLQRIDSLKTGALIKSAVLLGCIAADVQEEAVLSAAETYAENIGFAFQVVDDILDVTSDTDTLGKPVGSDAKNAKSTFVSLLGLEACKSLANRLTEYAVQALDAFPRDTEFLKELANQLAVRKN